MKKKREETLKQQQEEFALKNGTDYPKIQQSKKKKVE